MNVRVSGYPTCSTPGDTKLRPLVGEAYDPMTDDWAPFEVDIETGELRGGSYPPELP